MWKNIMKPFMIKSKNRTVNLTAKAVIFSLLLLGITNSVYGQAKDTNYLSRNTFYIDFSTKGAIYSVNYDRIFHESNKITYSYRIGFSILKDVIALPIGINLFTGKGNSHAEFSLSLMSYVDQYNTMFSDNDLSDKYIYITPAIGYRYQKRNGGFFFKAALSPMIILDPRSSNFWKMDPEINAASNLSFGYNF